MPLAEETNYQVIGKGLYDGVPRAINVTSTEIRQSLVDVMSQIANEVLAVLDYITAQTLADIYQRGIIITGGSALIGKLDKFLEEQLQIRVFSAEQPLLSVVHGISKIGTNNRLLERVKIKEHSIDWRASEALIVGAPY
jgi:rod shape-determining protein MreB and related proteins